MRISGRGIIGEVKEGFVSRLGFAASPLSALFVALLLCSGSPALGDEAPLGARALIAAYPEQLVGYEDGELIWADGRRIAYEDGRSPRSFSGLLCDPDPADQMSIPYPPGSLDEPPAPGHDPGRVRCEPLFNRMYGSTRAEVRSRLVWVRWLPEGRGQKSRVLFTSLNGAADALAEVAAELAALPERLRSIAARLGGGFAWRRVRGTDRRSPHSWGIAVDLGGDRADYWRWSRPLPGGEIRYRNRIPERIVAAFERNGFIWGGKWHHYDTMHFEYRPELLHAARLAKQRSSGNRGEVGTDHCTAMSSTRSISVTSAPSLTSTSVQPSRSPEAGVCSQSETPSEKSSIAPTP
jgi:hypothetical protein